MQETPLRFFPPNFIRTDIFNVYFLDLSPTFRPISLSEEHAHYRYRSDNDYIEYAHVGSRKGVIRHLQRLSALTVPHNKETASYETLRNASDM